ncbi:MAG: adenylosuccinate synthase, partial [Nannocystaceae bacterium]
MKTLGVVGAQWGDEGKGKVVDVLAAQADVVARYSGGNNAGHTLVMDGKKIITHLVPSGCAYPGTACVLGAGMVIDVEVLQEEVAGIKAHGLLGGEELKISLDAHLIMPYHRDLDGLREDSRRGAAKIGTTRRGIGPCYEAKAARRGIKVRDLFDTATLRSRLEANAAAVDAELVHLGAPKGVDVDALMTVAAGWGEWLAPSVCDVGGLVDDAINDGKRVLFEGAQGALLDVDHGTYPYVTSTTTTAGGISAGLGIGPTKIRHVWGITKAYTTRVGAGPFPTRAEPEEEAQIRAAGGEFGATTGRPRDCGWLDLPALRFAARVNGLTGLCVTKLDVLAMLPEVRVCRAYRDGLLPGRDGFSRAEATYETLSGWGDPALQGQLRAARSPSEIPGTVRKYLDLIEEDVGVPVTLLGVGPDRTETIS